MPRTIINNVTIVESSLRENHCVVIDDERITMICAADSVRYDNSDRVFDGHGLYVAPGYIDLHLHGTENLIVDDGKRAVEQLCHLLPRYGVTGFLPTVSPRVEGTDAEHLSDLAAVKSEGTSIFGFFLEGPFLTLTGALPPESCGRPTEKRIRSLVDAAGSYRTIFAVAPDLPDVHRFIPMMAENGNPVFITHTAANVKQTQDAIDAGARHATHFYDVFPHPPVTDPGVRPCGAVEAVLADERVSVDFILDGEHVDPVAVKMALKCKGPELVCLITDANLGAGLPPGIYNGVGGEVEFAYPGAPARMTKNSGQPGGLAGSGLTLDAAVRNAVKLLGVDIPSAVSMATANPARVLNLERERGHLKEGYFADLVLLDNTLNVKATWVNGRQMYSSIQVD